MSDDDDFVVPDNVQKILEEEGSLQNDAKEETQNNAESEDKSVTFNADDSDAVGVQNDASVSERPTESVPAEHGSIPFPTSGSVPPIGSESNLPPPAPQRQEVMLDPPIDIDAPPLKMPQEKKAIPFKKIIAVLLITAVGGSSIFFGYRSYSDQVAESQKILGSQTSIEDAVSKVFEIVELAPDERPAEVATVDDPGKLSNNPFFNRAKTGDLVLIYAESRIAVLFRPATNKVIAIGPVDPNQGSTSSSTSNSNPPPTPASIRSETPAATSAPGFIAPTITALPTQSLRQSSTTDPESARAE